MLLATLAKLMPRERWPAFPATPATLPRWHREPAARRWTYLHRRGSQRGLDDEVVDLVLRRAGENRRWGYLCIVSECRSLGVSVSASSVQRILRRHQVRFWTLPRRSDLEPVPARPGERALRPVTSSPSECHPDPPLRPVCHQVQRRRVHLAGITARPTGAWVNRSETCSSGRTNAPGMFRSFIRDRDAKFCAAFGTVFAAAGI